MSNKPNKFNNYLQKIWSSIADFADKKAKKAEAEDPKTTSTTGKLRVKLGLKIALLAIPAFFISGFAGILVLIAALLFVFWNKFPKKMYRLAPIGAMLLAVIISISAIKAPVKEATDVLGAVDDVENHYSPSKEDYVAGLNLTTTNPPEATSTPEVESSFKPTFTKKPELKVHFINVGYGDAILVENGDSFMLIDAGDAEHGPVVVEYLRSLGISKLDIVISTNANSEHIGGLYDIINSFSIDMFIMCPVENNTQTFKNVITAVQKKNIQITVPQARDEYFLNDAVVKVMGPVTRYSDTNNSSVVVQLRYGNNSFMFASDCEAIAEENMLGSMIGFRSDVLKVGNHGNNTSTSDMFLKSVNPAYAVISVGQKEGEEISEVLSKLAGKGVQTFRTDKMGTIVCTSDGSELTWTVEFNLSEDDGRNEFVLNNGAMTFHTTSCPFAQGISDEDGDIFEGTAEELIEQGYSPCDFCCDNID